jgi:hypothetical protein
MDSIELGFASCRCEVPAKWRMDGPLVVHAENASTFNTNLNMITWRILGIHL